MTVEKFNEIWTNIVVPTWKELDVDNISCLKISAEKKVYKQYQIEREYIHAHCMENAEGYIDRHKIAACLMCAIENVQPVKIPFKEKLKLLRTKTQLSKKMTYINEYVAFYCAISILDEFYNYDLKRNAISPRRKKIELPQCTFCDQHGYVFDVCLDLYFGKIRNKLNILTYANLFFVLEYDFSENEKGNCNKYCDN